MVLNKTKHHNTVNLCCSSRNQDEHSTVIPMSTSLLVQSVPDFEESTVAFPLKSLCYFFPSLVIFPISVLTSLKVHCFLQRGGLQDAWLATRSTMADCFLPVQ